MVGGAVCGVAMSRQDKNSIKSSRYKTIKKRGRLCDAVGEVLSVQCDWRLPCMCIRLLHDTCCSRMRGCIGPGRASRTGRLEHSLSKFFAAHVSLHVGPCSADFCQSAHRQVRMTRGTGKSRL